jgi:hypothetical protein
MSPILKPSKHAAVLVQERVSELLHDPAIAESEKVALQEFHEELDAYLS